MKNLLTAILLLVVVGLLIWACTIPMFASYAYRNQISSYWTLADKASTIDQKSEYIDKYVQALKDAKLDGLKDAWFLNTPNISFDENFKALLSLQTRLSEIKTMNPSSFEYQTAIQQITAQEQGQADEMLNNFISCWYKKNHFVLWALHVYSNT